MFLDNSDEETETKTVGDMALSINITSVFSEACCPSCIET